MAVSPLECGCDADLAERLTRFPPTRYQGSKRKLMPWLAERLTGLDFETALDAFGGTGCVAYLLKAMGKRVTYNDQLRANAEMATGLIANDAVTLADGEIDALLGSGHGARRGDGSGEGSPVGTFIAETFGGIYFTDEENAWLDRMCSRVRGVENRFARALSWYALFQAAMVKRPYNLFHRRNLYMRLADVPRSFGNKRTWDTSFAEHFRTFAAQANAAVIDGGGRAAAVCGDAAEVGGEFDLVYIDPPYVNGRGTGVDYAGFYHFLEGMLDYDDWAARVDWDSKHLRLKRTPTPWTRPGEIAGAFARVFERFREAKLVVSYRSDGTPSIAELAQLMGAVKRRVDVHEYAKYQYALSRNRKSREVLLIGQ